MHGIKDHLGHTFLIVQRHHEKSLKGSEIIYRNVRSKITPKWLFRHAVNISNKYIATRDADYISVAGWNGNLIANNIIGWLNENTKGRYFIVLFNRLEDGYIKPENRDRIHFCKKLDAAAFKMYFK